MLKTPLTVLLVLLCLGLLSLGEAGASSMAESTLVKEGCSCTSADIVGVGVAVRWRSWECCERCAEGVVQ